MKTGTLLPKAVTAVKRTFRVSGTAKRVPQCDPKTFLAPIPLPLHLKKKLAALRSRYWQVAVGTGAFLLLGTISLLLFAQSLADWWFDLPWLARAGFLAGDAILLISLYRRYLHESVSHRMYLTDTALLVERKWPHLHQGIVTAVEMSEGTSNATRGSRQLVDVILQQAAARTMSLDFKEVVPTRPFFRCAMFGSVATLLVLALAAVTWPSSGILLERIFLANIPLPTKTVVVAMTGDFVVPIGGDAEVSALARGIVPAYGRVVISYAGSEPQEFPLTSPPDKPGVFSYTAHNVQKDFKYQFFLNDGHGAEFTVTGKVPPGVAKLECQEIYPNYTKLPPQSLDPSQLSLLAGSHLKVKATASEALKSATIVLQGVSTKIAMTLDGTGTKMEGDIPIPAQDLTGFSIHMVDTAKVTSTNETIYPIFIVADEPPVVKLLEPTAESETITLRAKPIMIFEASDDYGLSKLSLQYQLIPPPVAGQEAPPALPTVSLPIKLNPELGNQHYEVTLDIALQTPPWKEGWKVNYWIEAVDNNTSTGPGITRTEPKSFGLLSPEAKRAEMVKRIEENAAELENISDTQQTIINDVGIKIPQK